MKFLTDRKVYFSRIYGNLEQIQFLCQNPLIKGYPLFKGWSLNLLYSLTDVGRTIGLISAPPLDPRAFRNLFHQVFHNTSVLWKTLFLSNRMYIHINWKVYSHEPMQPIKNFVLKSHQIQSKVFELFASAKNFVCATFD